MHIFFYNHAPEIGGAERSLLALMQEASAHGHRVELAAPPGALLDAAAHLHLPVIPVAPLALGYSRHPLVLARYLWGAATPLLDLWRAVRSAHPAIVHANSIRSGLLAAAVVPFVRPRPALVVHLRDALGHGLLDRLVAVAIASQATVVIAISRYVARHAGIARTSVRVLYNAIDPSAYQATPAEGVRLRARFAIPANDDPPAPLLAVVAQLTPWKGQMDALEAFALLRRSPAYAQAHLLVAGSAKFTGKHRRYDMPAYRDALVARTDQPDLHGYAHVVGEVHDVASLYAAATLLVAPSWEEPFGRVVVEAMAAGCPVLATRAGGIPEIITHGVDGWLVPPRDPPALAQAMALLLDDPQLRARLAESGRATVARRFALPRYMAEMEDIWQSLPARVSRLLP